MEATGDSREPGWWTLPDEGYWQAVLEQGQIAPDSPPPADYGEIFDFLGVEAGVETGADPPERDAGNGPGEKELWQEARLRLDRGDLFDLTVSGANRGGLLVNWNGFQGFVPASHLSEMPRNRDTEGRVAELSQRIGDSLTLCLIEVDPEQRRIVFSERLAASGPRSPGEIFATLSPGDVCRGTVTNLTSFGAFVDLGGVEGLIHISEISWDRVRHPGDAFRLGQEVEVHVLGVNPEEGRIALSVKRLRPDPWAQAEARYQPGQTVEGTVTNVVDFGAFVRVEEGLEGLVHVSELAAGGFGHPRSVVREGQRVRARVLNVDGGRRRLGLSLRQVPAPQSSG